MPGRASAFEALAEQAAERIDAARAQGQQLSLLADDEPATVAEGRAVRGKGKAMSQMREFLASRGYRMPEEALAQMAALASRDDAVMTAMVTAERIVTWAYAGAKDKDGNRVDPSPASRMRAFETAYTVQLRALDALMPYGLAKVTPDGAQQAVVTINMPAPAPDAAAQARDVTPLAPSAMPRFVPADVAWQMQQDQQVSGSASVAADGDDRTERASD